MQGSCSSCRRSGTGQHPDRRSRPTTSIASHGRPMGALIAVGYGIRDVSCHRHDTRLDLDAHRRSWDSRLDIGFGHRRIRQWRPPGRTCNSSFRGQPRYGRELYIVEPRRNGPSPPCHRQPTRDQRLQRCPPRQPGHPTEPRSPTTRSCSRRPPAGTFSASSCSRCRRREPSCPRSGSSSTPRTATKGGQCGRPPEADSCSCSPSPTAASTVSRSDPATGPGPATIIGPPTTTHRSMERGWSPGRTLRPGALLGGAPGLAPGSGRLVRVSRSTTGRRRSTRQPGSGRPTRSTIPSQAPAPGAGRLLPPRSDGGRTAYGARQRSEQTVDEAEPGSAAPCRSWPSCRSPAASRCTPGSSPRS